MVRVERDVFIHRSREEVFAYVTDPANDALWNSTIVETVLTSDGPLGAGSTLRSTIRFMGQHTDSTFEVTDYEPDRKMCVKSTSGPIAFIGCRVIELAEGGTRVIQSIEGEGGFFRVAPSMISNILGRQLEADLGTLKRLVEGHN